MKLELKALKDALIKKRKAAKISETAEEVAEEDNEENEATDDSDEEEDLVEIIKEEKPTESLMERYTKLASKKMSFGRKGSWYTLKFNILKECSAAKYYVVQMEFSNDDEGENLNIWLKATFIQDVLKYIAGDTPFSIPLFNGFHDVVLNGALNELREKPYGENVFRGNKKDGYTYKDYTNYYLIPKMMGSYKCTIEKFTNTMVDVLKSENFFTMMTVYQNERNNRGGQPGNVLRDPKAEVWAQLKADNNYRINYISALNAKFMDIDIDTVLMHLFGENSIEARYQSFGWDSIKSNPWKKNSKKK